MRTATRRGASIALAAATIGALTFGTLSAAYAETPDELPVPLVPVVESPIATEEPPVVPDTVRPTISIDSPLGGSPVRSELTVTITGSDDVQLSRLSANLYGPTGFLRAIGSTPANGLLDSPSTRTWTIATADLAEGTYTVRAGSRDAAGNVATTNASFIVDRTRPTVNLVAPEAGLITKGGFAVTVEGSDDVSLSRLVANLYDASNSTFLQPIGSTPGGGSLTSPSSATWTIPSGLADGIYTIRASSTDSAGNVQATSRTFVIDNTRPSIEILSPLSGSVFRDGFDVTVRGSDLNGLQRLTANLYNGANSTFLGPIGTTGTDLPTDGEPVTRTWAIPAGLEEGTYTIRASARDAADNVGSTSVTFTVDRTRPSVIISQPSADSFQNGAFDVTVVGEDGVGLKRLAANLYDESNTTFLGPIGSTPGSSALGGTEQSATWSFPTGLADGVYTIRASARDLADNVGSTRTTVTLDTAGPTVAYLAPTAGDEFSGPFTAEGTAADALSGIANDELTVHVRGVNPATGNCGGFLTTDIVEVVDGEWELEIAADELAPGDYCITVLGVDNAGNPVPSGGKTLKTFTVVEPTVVEEIVEEVTEAAGAAVAAVQQFFAPASSQQEGAQDTEQQGETDSEPDGSATTDGESDVQLQTQALSTDDPAAAGAGFPWWIIAVVLAIIALALVVWRRSVRTA